MRPQRQYDRIVPAVPSVELMTQEVQTRAVVVNDDETRRRHASKLRERGPSQKASHESGASSSSPCVTKARSSSEPANGAASASARASTSSGEAPARRPA